MTTVTEEALIADIERAWEEHQARHPNDSAALTTKDVRARLKCGSAKAAEVIQSLLASGRWEHCKIMRRAMNGVFRPVDAYRPVQK